MKEENIQQEVLVLAHTSFAQKALVRHHGGNKRSYSAKELERGLWNGLLNEMLPEVTGTYAGAAVRAFYMADKFRGIFDIY